MTQIWVISSTRDIKTYIDNACGGDEETQRHMYHLIYEAPDRPEFGTIWDNWLDKNAGRLYEEATRLACTEGE